MRCSSDNKVTTEVPQVAGAPQRTLAYAQSDNRSKWLEVIEMILARSFMHATSYTHLHTGRNALRERHMRREEFCAAADACRLTHSCACLQKILERQVVTLCEEQCAESRRLQKEQVCIGLLFCISIACT